jgi:hypothetical protein
VAKLKIVCRANGQLDHHVALSTKISPGEIGGAYRIDEKATQTRSFKFSDDNTISIEEEPPLTLAGAKRFHIQLEPKNGPVLVFDFDLIGVDKAIDSLRCRNFGYRGYSATREQAMVDFKARGGHGFYQCEFGLVQWARYAIAAIESGLLPTIKASSSFTRYRNGLSPVASPALAWT